MKIYSVFEQNDKKTVFIEERFSIIACFFQVFWLAYNKIWLATCVMVTVYLIINYMARANFIGEEMLFSFKVIIALVIAAFAKTWYIESLKRKKYKLKSIIAVKNLDEAKLRFYQQISKE